MTPDNINPTATANKSTIEATATEEGRGLKERRGLAEHRRCYKAAGLMLLATELRLFGSCWTTTSTGYDQREKAGLASSELHPPAPSATVHEVIVKRPHTYKRTSNTFVHLLPIL